MEKEESVIPKLAQQEDVNPQPLPKDSEQQQILSAVAALPTDAVNDINNEIQKEEEKQ